MHVLILNWKDLRHPDAGGAEVFTWEIARRLVAAGNRVTWFAARPRGLASSDEYDGVEVARAGGRLGVYRDARRFWCSERRRFDLVIDEVNTRAFLAPRFVREVPVVALVHQACREVWFTELPGALAVVGRFILEPSWLAWYRHVPTLTISPSSAASLQRYGLRLVAEVGVGLSVPDRLPGHVKQAQPTVLYLGRMVPSKRPDHLLEAMRWVWRRVPEACLWMVGSGPKQASLARRAARLLGQAGLPEDRVRFYGRVGEAEKFELLTRAWVLAMASVREGWGLVVDEAAACGTPTVAYRVAGLCDSVPAARGTLTDPCSQALGEGLLAELSSRSALAGCHVPGWAGGAGSWDDVTRRLIEAIRLGTGLSLSAPARSSARTRGC